MFDYIDDTYDYDQPAIWADSDTRPATKAIPQKHSIEDYCATLAKRDAALTAMAANRKPQTSKAKKVVRRFASFLVDSLNDFASSTITSNSEPANTLRFQRSVERNTDAIGWSAHR